MAPDPAVAALIERALEDGTVSDPGPAVR